MAHCAFFCLSKPPCRAVFLLKDFPMNFGLTFGLGGKQTATPGFSPANISGLALWFDASDISTIIQTGGYISQWNDKSGYNRHATQASGSSQPVTGSRTVNGLNVIDFDGSGDFMNVSSSIYSITAGPSHLFVVCSRDTLAVEHRAFFGLSASSQGWGLKLQSGSGAQQQYFHGTSPIDLGPLSNTSAHIFEGWRSGSVTEGSLDNGIVATGSSANFSLASLTIGCRPGGTAFLNGAIAEIIAFNRVLSSGERGEVNLYLKTKWGTP
jgi:hypothetical protein